MDNEKDVDVQTPQFYIQLFSEWKENEEYLERMIRDLLLDHFLPEENDY